MLKWNYRLLWEHTTWGPNLGLGCPTWGTEILVEKYEY